MHELLKFCKECQVEHPTSMFSRAGKGEQLRPLCKPCTSKREREQIAQRRSMDGEKPATKICSKCEVEKPFDTKNFKRLTAAPHGLTTECKACLVARNAGWKKGERGRATTKKWRDANLKNVRASALRSQARRREKVNAYQAIWRAKNIDRERERARKAAARYRDTRAVYRHLRRAAGHIEKGDVSRLHTLQKGCCAICRDALNGKWEIDHMQPIRKGGKTLFTNLQLLCRTCNRSKGARDPIEHMQRNGFLL